MFNEGDGALVEQHRQELLKKAWQKLIDSGDEQAIKKFAERFGYQEKVIQQKGKVRNWLDRFFGIRSEAENKQQNLEQKKSKLREIDHLKKLHLFLPAESEQVKKFTFMTDLGELDSFVTKINKRRFAILDLRRKYSEPWKNGNQDQHRVIIMEVARGLHEILSSSIIKNRREDYDVGDCLAQLYLQGMNGEFAIADNQDNAGFICLRGQAEKSITIVDQLLASVIPDLPTMKIEWIPGSAERLSRITFAYDFSQSDQFSPEQVQPPAATPVETSKPAIAVGSEGREKPAPPLISEPKPAPVTWLGSPTQLLPSTPLPHKGRPKVEEVKQIEVSSVSFVSTEKIRPGNQHGRDRLADKYVDKQKALGRELTPQEKNEDGILTVPIGQVVLDGISSCLFAREAVDFYKEIFRQMLGDLKVTDSAAIVSNRIISAIGLCEQRVRTQIPIWKKRNPQAFEIWQRSGSLAGVTLAINLFADNGTKLVSVNLGDSRTSLVTDAWALLSIGTDHVGQNPGEVSKSLSEQTDNGRTLNESGAIRVRNLDHRIIGFITRTDGLDKAVDKTKTRLDADNLAPGAWARKLTEVALAEFVKRLIKKGKPLAADVLIKEILEEVEKNSELDDITVGIFLKQQI